MVDGLGAGVNEMLGRLCVLKLWRRDARGAGQREAYAGGKSNGARRVAGETWEVPGGTRWAEKAQHAPERGVRRQGKSGQRGLELVARPETGRTRSVTYATRHRVREKRTSQQGDEGGGGASQRRARSVRGLRRAERHACPGSRRTSTVEMPPLECAGKHVKASQHEAWKSAQEVIDPTPAVHVCPFTTHERHAPSCAIVQASEQVKREHRVVGHAGGRARDAIDRNCSDCA